MRSSGCIPTTPVTTDSDQDTLNGSTKRSATSNSTIMLRPYVAGATAGSQRAISNLRAICESELAGRYELEAIDIYQRHAGRG